MFLAISCAGSFSIGTAKSKNAQSIFITHLFGGLFVSAPASNFSATLGGFWGPAARGTALSNLGWHWTMYVEAFESFLNGLLCVFCLPERYVPVLLKKARNLRTKITF